MDYMTYELLKIFSERNSLNLIQLSAILNSDPIILSEPVIYLLKNKYIRASQDFKEHIPDSISLTESFKITYLGRISLVDFKNKQKHFRYTEFRAWITLLIAVAAFIKSFFF